MLPAHTLLARHSLCFRAVRRPAVGWEWESGGEWVCLRAGFTDRQLLQSFLISSLMLYYIVRTQKEFLTACLYEVTNLLISFFPEAPVLQPLVSPHAEL